MSLTIRRADPGDAGALARVAALDSAPALAGDVLVAEVGGELRAALSLTTGKVIADPFHRTDDLVSVLRLRAKQLQGEPRRRPRSRRTLRTAPRSA